MFSTSRINLIQIFQTKAFFGLVVIGLMLLRSVTPKDKIPFKVPFYPWLPILYLAGVIFLIVFRAYFEWLKSLADLAFIATGIPLSFFWLKKKKREKEKEKEA